MSRETVLTAAPSKGNSADENSHAAALMTATPSSFPSGTEVALHPELWRALFVQSSQASVVTNPQGQILEANAACADILQKSEETLRGLNIQDVLAKLDPALRAVIRTNQARVSFAQQDFLFVYLQDIREQKFAERLLLFFATTLKSLDALFGLAHDETLLLHPAARSAAEGLCDWCRIDVLTDSQLKMAALAHTQPDLESDLLEISNKIQNRSTPLCNEFLSPSLVLRSGLTTFKPNLTEEALDSLGLPHELRAQLQTVGLSSYICAPIRKADTVIGCIAFARGPQSQPFDPLDLIMAEEFTTKIGVIIERAQLYKSLAEMKNAAEAANRAKTNFLANVSHEIRTPLGAIVGFSELLLGTGASEQDRQSWGAKIRRNSRHLLRIINDILDLSKVEVGKLNMEITQVDLNKVLHDIYSLTHVRTVEKNIELKFHVEGAVPAHISSDETRLAQILSNIIGNAVKFTSSGSVSLTIGMKNHPERGSLLGFEVQDTGPGLTEEQASRLFKPFSQADTSYTRQFGGTGLGLALSRNLARGLGGDLILAASQPGEGSSFLITIDPGKIHSTTALNLQEIITLEEILPPAAEKRETTLALPLKGKKILLVEDSEDIQILFNRFLETAGAEISLANNGHEALTAAQASTYDVILMDVQMPVMDGCEATRQLRSLGYDGLIVALTAHAMKEEYDRCLEAGYNAHLSKPIRRQELITQILRLSVDHQKLRSHAPH